MDGVLVLGGGGFLGAHVVAEAVGRAQREATFAAPQGPPVHAQSRNPVLAPRFTQPRDAALWFAAELGEPGSAADLVRRLDPALVLNCAALSRLAECEAHADRARRLNTDLPAELGAICAERGVRLLHVSTDLVFGGRPPRATGYRPTDPPEPLSEYGRSKAAGEATLLDADPSALVVRLPLLYGNSGGRGLGASDSLLEAVEHDQVPGLFVDEFRTPLEVTDAARALLDLADSDAAGVLHVAGPERIDRHAFGLLVLDAMGVEPAAARELVRAVHQADLPGAELRPADVSLDGRAALPLLASPLAAPRRGLSRAMR